MILREINFSKLGESEYKIAIWYTFTKTQKYTIIKSKFRATVKNSVFD